MKKVIALLLVMLMGLGILSGCSRDENDKGPVIKMYVSSYPQNLDPAIMQADAEITKFFGLIYEALTAIDSKGNVVPALAKSWYGKFDEIDENYKMYFELNETKWSDGIAVSADDVVYAWKRILQPTMESPYASLLFPIKNARNVKSGVMTSDDLGLAAIDDTLLEVTFEKEYDIELFAKTVSCLGLVPLREVTVEKDPVNWATKATTLATNGPFKVQNMEYNAEVVLERSSYYRLTEDDKFDKYVKPHRIIIEYKTNSNNGAQYQEELYEAGTIYYLGDFTKEGYEKYKDKIISQNMLSSYTYFFNTTKPIFSNEKVRQALSVAIDREEIAKIAGGGKVAANGYVPHGVFDIDNKKTFREAAGAVQSTTGDIEKAKQLLKEAGVSSGSFTLSYKGNLFENVDKEVAEYVAGVWNSLGFNVEVKAVSGVNYTEAITNSDFDVIGIDIIGNMVDAFGYLAPYAKHYSGNIVSISLEDEAFSPHYTGLENDEYDALIDEIVYCSDAAKRTELLHQAEQKLIELMPATALYFHVDNYMISSELSKVSSMYFGYRNFNKTSLKNYLEINSMIAEENNATESPAAE